MKKNAFLLVIIGLAIITGSCSKGLVLFSIEEDKNLGATSK